MTQYEILSIQLLSRMVAGVSLLVGEQANGRGVSPEAAAGLSLWAERANDLVTETEMATSLEMRRLNSKSKSPLTGQRW